MTKTALVVVDVQNDFIEGGSLAVAGGMNVASKISLDLIDVRKYDIIGLTKDWHIDPGEHWSIAPDFVTSWPVHCQAYSQGAKLNIGLVASIYVEFSDQLSSLLYQVNVFHKGQYSASYSGLDGVDRYGISLATWLKEHNITNVDVVGIAYDYCVKETALGLAAHGFNVRVLKSYTASVHPEFDSTNTSELTRHGVEVFEGLTPEEDRATL